MLAKLAAAIRKYPEGVLTGVGAQGYPFSVRQTALAYDAAASTLPVVIPAALDAVAGPANLLCHFHDDDMWNMHMISVRGRIERRGEAWIFIATDFTPPSVIDQFRRMARSANTYLEKRNLPRPQVNFAAIDALWQRAKKLGRT